MVAQLEARPGKEAELKAALAGLAAPTRAVAGCVAWELYDDPQNPARFLTVELWADGAALAVHMDTPHVRAVAVQADALLAVPPDIRSLRQIA